MKRARRNVAEVARLPSGFRNSREFRYGLIAALLALPLCSCRAPSWVTAPTQWATAPLQRAMEPEGQPNEIPNNRHLSNWNRLHGGAGPKREQYTHQPRQYPMPQLPVPAGPPTSFQHLQSAYNAPPMPESAYHGVNYEVVQAGHRDDRGGCPTCRGGRHPALPCPGFEGCDEGPDCTRMPDEYICDGGDREVEASVLQDWTVRGLDTEDTIAHYDTQHDGTHVEVANRVCIYAPRFAAVRTVRGMAGHQQELALIAARDRMLPHGDDTLMIATTGVQNVQPVGQFGLRPVNIYQQKDIGIPLERTVVPAGLSIGFLPHEDFKLIRHGIADLAEKARLANAIDNAIAWTGDQAVKAAIDGKLPVEASNNVAAEQLYVYDFGKSRLRIVKTASKQNAKPGEIIDFTLRFDNIGDQTVGNVTVLDSLTTRLEYVDKSVQSSVAADFYTQANEGDSLVLRFEVVEPVKVGQGGVIRFQARVR